MNTTTGVKKNLKGSQTVPALRAGRERASVAHDHVLLGHRARARTPAGLRRRGRRRRPRTTRRTTAPMPRDDHRAAGAEPPWSARSRIPPPRSSSAGASRSPTRCATWAPSARPATSTKYYLVSDADGSKKDLQGTQAVPAPQRRPDLQHAADTDRPAERPRRRSTRSRPAPMGARTCWRSVEDDNCLTSSAIVKVMGAAGPHRDGGDREERAAHGGAWRNTSRSRRPSRTRARATAPRRRPSSCSSTRTTARPRT